MSELESIWKHIRLILKSHPWHGVSIGAAFPEVVTSFIEIVPTDTVKYEIDKFSGFLKVDRPQKYSNICPSLYGFIPQTLCRDSVAEFCMQKTGRKGIKGDDDPLDICILSEKPINHGNILVQAIPIGGLRMIDGNEADDKIIAVLKNDNVYGQWNDINDCPTSLIERLKHYFLTYKDAPDNTARTVEIADVYDKNDAFEVIRRSFTDYLKDYSSMNELLNAPR